MKARILLAFLLFISIFSAAQIQDLAKLADGKLVFNSFLRDNEDKLFGYFFLYERNIGTDSVTMEYVLLDKNLNKALNGTFNEPKLKSKYIRSYHKCYLMGKKLIIYKIYLIKKFGSVDQDMLYTFQTIDLDSNKISKELKYSKREFVNVADNFDQELELHKSGLPTYNIDVLFSDSIRGFLVKTRDYFSQEATTDNLHYFDENFNYKWTYVNEQQKESFIFGHYKLLHIQGNNVYLGISIVSESVFSSYHIVALDLVSKEKKFEYQFDNKDLDYQRSIYFREVDGQLNIIGSYTKRKTFTSGYDFTKSLGFYQIRLDSVGNELLSKDYPWINFNQQLTLDDKGYDDEKYKLMPRQYFMLKDGSISILAERYRPAYKGVELPIPLFGIFLKLATMRKECTDDFVLMNFDYDMNLVRLDTIAKKYTKNNFTDYQFSEYIHDREGLVFFYINSFKADRKQQVVLGINTILNGTVTEEKLQLYSKKEYAIYPMPAKEGYVMLREVNEKKKHNQIRLEKLNYDAL